jgi:hypothetical protein
LKPTREARALHAVLDEIDDIVRATLGSITLATMLKIADRHKREQQGRYRFGALSSVSRPR